MRCGAAGLTVSASVARHSCTRQQWQPGTGRGCRRMVLARRNWPSPAHSREPTGRQYRRGESGAGTPGSTPFGGIYISRAWFRNGSDFGRCMCSRPLVAPFAVVLAQGASRTSPSAYRVRLRPYVGQIVRCKRWAWYRGGAPPARSANPRAIGDAAWSKPAAHNGSAGATKTPRAADRRGATHARHQDVLVPDHASPRARRLEPTPPSARPPDAAAPARCIAPIGLDPVARPLGDQRRRDHDALMARSDNCRWMP